MFAKKTKKRNAPAKARKATKKDNSPVVKVTPIDQRDFPLEPKKAKRVAGETAAPTERAPREELCVFAFRLTRDERDVIHATAGSAKASRFVRSVALAAARGDMKAIEEAIEESHAKPR